MANALYDAGRQGFLDGSIDWDTNTIKCVLVKSTYTVNLATHDNLDDVGAGTRLATSDAFTGKTTTAGVADADNVTIASVPTGPVTAIILFKDTGVESTSRLIAYIDTATGLPLTTDSTPVQIVWDNGANKIFKL